MTSLYVTLSCTRWPPPQIQTLPPGIVHTFFSSSLYHHHVLRVDYIFPARGSARKYFGRIFFVV